MAYNPIADLGWVVIGSFDFNSDCIGRERYDCGIKTRHPDLIISAMTFLIKFGMNPNQNLFNQSFTINLSNIFSFH